VVSQQQS
jgi:DNA-binding protein HU-beta